MAQRVLFLSNGHGEDNHSAHVIRALRSQAPDVAVAALSLVGEGAAYRKLGVPLIGPTQTLPSGGFTYVNRWLLLQDIRAGLLGLTLRQLRAVRRYAQHCDLVHATGDAVGQSFAYLSGRPFISFISCLSALYEGHLQTDFVLRQVVRSPRCRAIVTRDPYTAEDLMRQGFEKVHFGGIPSLDWLVPQGKDLALLPETPMVALLPGSRLPEAVRNLKLQMRLVVAAAQQMGQRVQFRAALVPALMAQLGEIAATEGWQLEPSGQLVYRTTELTATIGCYDNAFSDILCRCDLVIGMAGLAVDQAVAIGKPVLQIPGEGPQFTYAFAEAQERLLGLSAQTIGTGPATPDDLNRAAQRIQTILQDADYRAACVENGRRRLGTSGASGRITHLILQALERPTSASSSPVAGREGDTPIP